MSNWHSIEKAPKGIGPLLLRAGPGLNDPSYVGYQADDGRWFAGDTEVRPAWYWRAAHQEAVHMVDQIERQLRKRLLPYTYRHFGSLVPLVQHGAKLHVLPVGPQHLRRKAALPSDEPVAGHHARAARTVFYVPRLACSHAVCRDVLGRSTNGRSEHHAHAQ